MHRMATVVATVAMALACVTCMCREQESCSCSAHHSRLQTFHLVRDPGLVFVVRYIRKVHTREAGLRFCHRPPLVAWLHLQQTRSLADDYIWNCSSSDCLPTAASGQQLRTKLAYHERTWHMTAGRHSNDTAIKPVIRSQGTLRHIDGAHPEALPAAFVC